MFEHIVLGAAMACFVLGTGALLVSAVWIAITIVEEYNAAAVVP